MADDPQPPAAKPGPADPEPRAAPDPVEVFPESPPRLNAGERWLLQNLTPLIIICLGLTIQSAVELLRPAPRSVSAPAAASAPRVGVPVDLSKKIMPLHLVLGLAYYGGAFVCFAFMVLAAVDEEKRAWLRNTLWTFPARPLPALRALDFIAAIVVLQTCGVVLSLMVIPFRQYFENNSGAAHALELAILDASMLVAIAAIVFLSRRRAGGPHGSEGFWPFWKAAWTPRPRTLWQDIKLGLLCYPLMLWLIFVSLLVNGKLVELFGGAPDKHALIHELTQKQSAWVLVVFFLAATVGAAVLEELLFRGMLYNVLRRYLGTAAGAVLAALLFAVVHFVWSQVLALFVLALILTWLYERTGRLVASMTLHAVNNLMSLLIAVFAMQ